MTPPHTDPIALHYTHGALASTLEAALAPLAGRTGAELLEQLGAIDEFHVGGRAATQALIDTLPLPANAHVLDIGCGLGGTARLLATRLGARVAGVDLTAEFVAVGNSLNARLGLAGQIALHCADALSLPFAAASFDAATLLHVGMNIADKPALFQEAARVLKPGGHIAIYDIMRMRPGPLSYPLPWAGHDTYCQVTPPAAYRQALRGAGFTLLTETDQSPRARAFFAAQRARATGQAPSRLGLHMLMGPEAGQKLANIAAQIESGLIAPVEILARRT
ncbi:class I SAM-dependent methyltransferase [Acidocella sp.]|uniref:class I SAM-dependent methyltransferase n=1 Tax=Acidocella sp. TaxID=50710 RepID=UPI002618BAEC|nr:class I SAM-dependent methyltransferase [Acidocella sp.]